MSNAPVSAKNVYQAFACRVWIQGRGVTVGQRTKDTFKNGLKWIGERCTERFNGVRKTLLVHSKVYITCGGDQETLLSRQLQRMLPSIGEVLCGCDKFNQQLYGKTFPYQAPNDTNWPNRRIFGIISSLQFGRVC